MKYNTTWLRWKGNCSTQLLLIGHERTSWVESYVISCHLRNVLYCTRGNITLLMTLHYRLLLTDLQTRYEEENKLSEVITEINYIRLRQSTAVWGMGHGSYTITDNTVLYILTIVGHDNRQSYNQLYITILTYRWRKYTQKPNQIIVRR